jgi:diguanylate cyclase (GGDEF)-like protein/PAS domain S-box-containing protein
MSVTNVRGTPDGSVADQLLRAVLESIIVIDLEGFVTSWSTGAEALYGWSADQAVGSHIDRLVTWLGDAPTDSSMLLEMAARGEGWEGELELRGRDEARTVHVRMSPLRGEDGSVLGSVGVATDVSRRTYVEQQLAASEARFRRVFDESPVGMVIIGPDADLHIQDANPAFSTMLGYEPGELAGQPLATVSAPEDLQREVELGLAMVAGKMPYYSIERALVRKDGSKLIGRSTASIIYDEQGEVLYGIGMVEDVTEQVAARETIRRQRERLDLVLESAGVCTWEVDLGTDALELSDNAAEVFGMGDEPPPADLSSFYAHVHPDDQHVFRELLPVMRSADPDERYTIDFRMITPSGAHRWIRQVGAWVLDEHGEPVAIRGTAVDATERRAHEQRIADQALIDEVTGLPNRALLLDRLQVGLRHLEEDGHLLVVLFVDLDRFKVINESLGHRVGDELLRQVGARLDQGLGPELTVARLGADEFVVLADEVSHVDGASELAKQVHHLLQAPFDVAGRAHHVSASIGLLTIVDPEAEPEAVLRDADAAASRAKARGGGHVEVFDPAIRTAVVARLELEEELRRGLAEDELVVHHQPVVTLEGRIVGFEALVRWEHPTRGLVPPGSFIPVAEQTGLVLPLGRFVLDGALRQLARWRVERPEAYDWTIAVNLSGRQLAEPGLVEEVREVIARHGLAPADLRLELTESMLMSGQHEIGEAIGDLRELGVRLSVDDFGTGYSSLVYLRRFPVDVLKLDRQFVQDVAHDQVDRAIVRSMIGLAHELGMQTVAEGVETLHQLEVLRSLGCDAGQGFYWSAALPAEAIEQHLLGPSPGSAQAAIVRGTSLDQPPS